MAIRSKLFAMPGHSEIAQ